MRRYAALLALLIWLSACQPSEDSHMKAIVGAVLIDGLGGPPLSESVVVVATDHIREAGARSTVLIPAEADKIDGSGKFLVPAPIDIYPSAQGPPPNPEPYTCRKSTRRRSKPRAMPAPP